MGAQTQALHQAPNILISLQNMSFKVTYSNYKKMAGCRRKRHKNHLDRVCQLLSTAKNDLDIVAPDLRSQNNLLDTEGNVQLIDFGLASRCRAGTMLQV